MISPGRNSPTVPPPDGPPPSPPYLAQFEDIASDESSHARSLALSATLMRFCVRCYAMTPMPMASATRLGTTVLRAVAGRDTDTQRGHV